MVSGVRCALCNNKEVDNYYVTYSDISISVNLVLLKLSLEYYVLIYSNVVKHKINAKP